VQSDAGVDSPVGVIVDVVVRGLPPEHRLALALLPWDLRSHCRHEGVLTLRVAYRMSRKQKCNERLA